MELKALDGNKLTKGTSIPTFLNESVYFIVSSFLALKSFASSFLNVEYCCGRTLYKSEFIKCSFIFMQQRVIVCLVARLVSNIKKNIYSFDQALDIRQDFLT